MDRTSVQTSFKDKNVLITGGLGFIGSNLALKLVAAGSRVTLLDAMLSGLGANPFNIDPIRDQVAIDYSDIRDEESINRAVRGKDYIFHLAGQNDHILSLTNPFSDIDINIKGSAVLLVACQRFNPEVRLVYTGTRGEYGSSASLPVSEEAPMNPKGIYELSSLTAQKLFKIYHENHGLKSVTLRLTNTYGPRAQMKHDRYGVVNWFIRKALDDETIKVFGDGSILRDFLYVDDVTGAILASACCAEAYGEVFNVGVDKPTSFAELAESVVSVSGSGRWELAPFPRERAAQEPGNFYSDISKIRSVVGWEPVTGLCDGLAATVDYYRKYKKHYW